MFAELLPAMPVDFNAVIAYAIILIGDVVVGSVAFWFMWWVLRRFFNWQFERWDAEDRANGRGKYTPPHKWGGSSSSGSGSSSSDDTSTAIVLGSAVYSSLD